MHSAPERARFWAWGRRRGGAGPRRESGVSGRQSLPETAPPRRLPTVHAPGGGRQATRLLAALSRELRTACRIIHLMQQGDAEASDDEVLSWLAALALDAGQIVEEGRERAWLLTTLLRLLEADVEKRPAEGALPRLRGRSPMPSRDLDLEDADFERLADAFETLDRPTRAAILLVIHEGLSLEDAVSVQGGTRTGFASRYRRGVRSLPPELLDLLMGRTAREERS